MKTKLLFLALFSIGLAQSQNLLQNGSFEQFTAGVPTSWTITAGTTLQETTTFNHGSSSLNATPVSALPSLPTILISQDFTLNDTDTYTLKFDYFIPGNSLTNYISGITYELILNNSAEAFFFPPNFTPATITYGTWKTVTFDFKLLLLRAPATSASLKLNLRAGLDIDFPDHHVYFDNVVIARKSSLSNVDFTKKSTPIVSVSKDEIVLNNDYKNSSYVIYSTDGKAVKRVNKNSSESIEISGLATGVYFLKLENVSTSVKFVKQ
ncbi:T9SS type A sorting domain-containing protein [Flavobacterium sp.]|uniref:T9SS type A sorting domain-containing protein n=1 Tax=Flavobacterium sp. TaxID=239 RepID=UPI00374CF328